MGRVIRHHLHVLLAVIGLIVVSSVFPRLGHTSPDGALTAGRPPDRSETTEALAMATATPTTAPGRPSGEQEDPEVLGVEAQAAVSAVCPGRFAVDAAGAALAVPYCAGPSQSLEGHQSARRAVVVVHGTSRNADDYRDYVWSSAGAAGVAATTVVIAPQFLTEEDVAGHNLTNDVLFWTSDGWKQGDESLSTTKRPRPGTISSFGVTDAILRRLADRAYFPSLQTIVVTGHSAGGQYTNRFAAGSGVEPQIGPAGLQIRYVIANPSSYLYFTGERRVAGTIGQFTAPSAQTTSQCPTWNRYKYGLERLSPYLEAVGNQQVPARYASRRVGYLLGQLDNRDSNSLDTSCPAMLQGEHRLERGTVYFEYLGRVFGPAVYDRHTKAIVPSVGHDGRAMYNSTAGRAYLFDTGPAPTATPTPTGTRTATPAPVATPTATSVSLACSPRPPVAVAARPVAPGALEVTVTARTPPGSIANRIVALRFATAANVRIDLGNRTDVPTDVTIPLVPPVPEVTFRVRRTQAQTSVTVPFVVTDGCGEWRTLVGGGPTAF